MQQGKIYGDPQKNDADSDRIEQERGKSDEMFPSSDSSSISFPVNEFIGPSSIRKEGSPTKTISDDSRESFQSFLSIYKHLISQVMKNIFRGYVSIKHYF